ncbi:Leucine-rich repeat-containing protein 66 [Cricetulus griseus]|uniref:Beta-sarcoglycan n=1 Tax=Cricetulus griseus TaxID=10029 RepID=G3IAA5_CRIGR|nr:Leucine-rich repeat-containing protein 66 [Cricetulus griseus]
MREKAVERRNVNKEHNSNFKAGYIPIDEDRLHKTGLRGRKGNLAICVIVLLFILAVINLLITLVIWAVIRIGPNGCDSMEFHESGLLRFKQVSDMGVIHPLYKSTVGGRRNENLVITGNNQPQGTTKLSVEKNKTSITSDIGMQFFDPRTQNILFSTDYETHEFHLPSGVKSLNVQKASTERITSNATSDLNIKVDGRAIVRGNEGVFIMGKTIEFHMGGNVELKAENSIILNGTVMVSPTRLPSSSSGDQSGSGDWVRYKLCMCADGTLFKVQVTGHNMGCQVSDNVVDLRSNALTTLAPIVTIALELPHLELDLADNQWRCGESNANFQNVTSASWREKWDAICNMSVGNEKPYLETPQIRISREAHLPPTPSDEKSFMQSKAERPQEGMDTHLSTLEKQAQVDHDDLKETRPQEETWMGYDDLEKIQPRPPTELRDSQNRHDTDRKDNDSPDLVLAICLSVFITFVVAFCLGAFARPYIDRLWQQSCLSKRPGSENAYANEGFYDEVEASRRVQCQGTELHQAPHHLNLYESQNPSWVTEPVLYDAVMSERELESSRMEFSGQQNPMQLEDSTGVRSGVCNVLPYAQVAHSALPGLPNVDTQEPISTEQDHYDVPEELHYHTVAQEYSLHEGVMDASSIASPLGTVPSSIDGRWDELHLSQSRDVVAPVSKTVVHTSTQGSGESKERGCPEPLGAMGSPMESSQVTNSIKGLATQLPSFQEADAEEEVSGVYDEVLYNDPEDVDSPSLMPRWDSGPHVTPASKEPVLRGDPFDSHYDLVTNYESDSDEGSLFTLSSEDYDDARSLPEEQVSVENGGASQPFPSRNLGEYEDHVTSAGSYEDITPQRIVEKCEIQEALFGNLISSPDSFV